MFLIKTHINDKGHDLLGIRESIKVSNTVRYFHQAEPFFREFENHLSIDAITGKLNLLVPFEFGELNLGDTEK